MAATESQRQGITEAIAEISEIVFDYSATELRAAHEALASGVVQEPISPRQHWGAADPASPYPPLARPHEFADERFRGACLKDPDVGFPFGLSVGLNVDGGNRFIRALSFCRRRRKWQVKGHGRMLRLRFVGPRSSRPFAIGNQCHFGLGLLVPVIEQCLSP